MRRPAWAGGLVLLAMVLAGCAPESSEKADEDLGGSELGGVGGTAGADGPDDTPDPDGSSTVPAGLADALSSGAWSLDLYSLEWVEGELLGGTITELLYARPVFGAATLEGGPDITLQAGILDEDSGAQDPCVATDTLSGTLDSDGLLTVSTDLATLPAPAFGTEVHLVDVAFTGTLDAESGALQDLSMAATWDARLDAEAFADLVGVSGPEGLCELLAGSGLPCTACEDGAPTCVPIAFAGAEPEPVDTEIVPIPEGCR